MATVFDHGRKMRLKFKRALFVASGIIILLCCTVGAIALANGNMRSFTACCIVGILACPGLAASQETDNEKWERTGGC